MEKTEMLDVVNKYCIDNICHMCVISDICKECNSFFGDDLDMLKKAYDKVINDDIVNHPSHYNREGAMESIDEMELIFGKEAVKNFCLCNVWKYRYRASDKNGIEDLQKSDWYLKKYKELCNEEMDYT